MSDEEIYYDNETFEVKLHALIPNITDKEFLKGAGQATMMCKCSSCSTFNSGHDSKLARCVLGKSIHVKEYKECLCNDCDFTKMMNLRWNYYCFQGNALRLSESESMSGKSIQLKK